MKKTVLVLALSCLVSVGIVNAGEFDIEQDGVSVPALEYGSGEHILIALPGAKPGKVPNRNALKKVIAEIADKAPGVKVISISWPDQNAVAATVRYAKANGAKKVSLLGHSRGAEMAGRYASAQPDGEIDSLILLSSADDQGIPLTKTKKLFVYNKGDSYAQWTPTSFEKSEAPKEIMALEGDGHLVDHLKEKRPTLIEDIVKLLSRDL